MPPPLFTENIHWKALRRFPLPNSAPGNPPTPGRCRMAKLYSHPVFFKFSAYTPEDLFLLKFRTVTIWGAQPSARLSEEICLSEGSAGVCQRALRGSLRGSCGALRGVRGIFRGLSGVVTLCLWPSGTVGISLWATPPVRLGLSGRNSGKTPEALSERFLEFPSRVRLGSPKPYNSRHLKPPEHLQNSLPSPKYGWGRLFLQKCFRRGPLRAGHWTASSTEGISDIKLPRYAFRAFKTRSSRGWTFEA